MDTNRIIKIEELEVGDEIIVPSNGKLRYWKLLRKPTINPKTGRQRAVKCSTNLTREVRTFNSPSRGPQTYNVDSYICTPDNHNFEKSVDLRWRDLWLVKRAI